MMISSKYFRSVMVCLLLGGSGLALLLQQGQSRVRAAQPVQAAQSPAQSGLSPRSDKAQVAAPNSPAATIIVNSLADGTPANNGQCTLREVLTNASDATQPTVASTNFGVNEVINNVFTVGLGADGAFNIFTPTSTDLVMDLSGYFAPSTLAGRGGC